eukprot:5401836-Prymnesium_polylepis.1
MVAAAPGDSTPPQGREDDAAVLHDHNSDDAVTGPSGVDTWLARAVIRGERARRQYVGGLWGARP